MVTGSLVYNFGAMVRAPPPGPPALRRLCLASVSPRGGDRRGRLPRRGPRRDDRYEDVPGSGTQNVLFSVVAELRVDRCAVCPQRIPLPCTGMLLTLLEPDESGAVVSARVLISHGHIH